MAKQKTRKKKHPISKKRVKSVQRKDFTHSEQIYLALEYQNSGKVQQAEYIFRHILSIDSNHYEANFSLAMLYHQQHRNDMAVTLLEKTACIRPDVYEVHLNLGVIQRTLGELEQAQNHLEQAIAIKPTRAKAHLVLGLLFVDKNTIEKAAQCFQQALRLQPDNAQAHAQMGLVLKAQGHFAKAIQSYRKSIALNPHYGEAHHALAYLLPFEQYNDDVSLMEKIYHSAKTSAHEKMILAFALGKVFDSLRDYPKAFHYLAEGNRAKKSSFAFSIKSSKDYFNQHKHAFDRDFIDRFRGIGQDDNTAIFILGMPRSGTSLVEQILASHSQVHGAGEINYTRVFQDNVQKFTGKPFPLGVSTVPTSAFNDIGQCYTNTLRKLSDTALRITDKLPHNFLRVGLIAAVFPKAKIIHCERDAMDNCFSIFQHYFSNAHGYASDLCDLGQYYQLYEELMSHWHSLLPGHLHRIHYEDLIYTPERHIKNLLDFCELAFEPSCLDFHKTDRIVNTPSATQVRKPLYKQAIGRSQYYKRELEPLRLALGSSYKNGH